ncbi:MAG: cysteine desulfurase [SAR324 cluster bacterium]|nr:cysteine desulfurase [SAR324 cluster bacterium]
MEPSACRADFPILERKINGHPLTYLDNAATTQKPRAVIGALTRFYEHHNANVHRGVHTLSEEATALFEDARATVARFIGASSARSIVFTRGTTESINLAAQAWARPRLVAGDEVLLTEMEHHSNIIPWQMLAREKGVVLRFVRVTPGGLLDREQFTALLGERTRLVGLTHTSNVLGTVNPLAELIAEAHRAGALVLVDAAQGVPRAPLDVSALDCDFLAFSGHKMLGPTGIGVLYGKEDLLAALEPTQGGGGMVTVVEEGGAEWREAPWRFEAGTPNIAGAAALGAAMDYLSGLGMERVQAHETALTEQALAALEATPGVTLYGPRDSRRQIGVIAFNATGVHPHDAAEVLDEVGVAVRGGHHCCQLLMRRLGVPAVLRASFSVYNDAGDVERLVAGLERVAKVFR